MPFPQGLRVLGSYVLLERLGEGGMGEVFKASDAKLDRVVALKVIRKDLLAHPDAGRRFQREIRAAAQLNHPNIIHVLDADEADGVHFFVMEYFEGTDLAKVVKRRGPLSVARACDYARQAALGLQHAHEHGLVHRDLKPHNLLLATHDDVIKVLDLGLARVDWRRTPLDRSATLTPDGTVMGTPDYIAPEQARDAHTADIRADLYSLGCTLYFLLTGRVPFPGDSLTQKLLRHCLDEPEPVERLRPETPLALAAVVRKLMAKRPEDRYQTPAQAASALEEASLQVAYPTGIPRRGSVPVELPAPGAPAGAAAESQEKQILRNLPRPDGRPHAGAGPGDRLWWTFGIALVVLTVVGGAVALFFATGFWWTVGIALVVLTVVGAVALFFAWNSTPGAVRESPQVNAVREPLRVNPAGGPKVYRTIKEAVDHAATNDRIILMADVTEADVRVPKKVENLVIESDPGRRATWKCPDALPANASARLLTLDHVTGFQLKGVALDGGGKADTLVSLLGTCPGVKLDDLDLKNYAKYGVFLWNCDGDRDRPVLLSNLRFTAAGKSQTALYFSFREKDSPKPQYFLTGGEWAFPPEGGKVQTTDAAALGNVKFPPGVTPEQVPSSK